MILKGAQIERALDKADPDWTLALLYGPDEAGSRVLAERFAATMGVDADRIDLDGATLKEDPARLPDEANAITMFGGPRWIRVTGGEETFKAVDALLSGPKGCPVVIVAGNLTKASALAKLAADDARVIACQSWLPEGAKADEIARQTAAPMGLRLTPEAAHMLADATGGDRALMMRELEKIALYVDGAPDRPRPVDATDIDAIGASLDVREPWPLVDALFDGRVADLAGEIAGEAAPEPIPSLRAVARRALNVARAHAAKRGGPMPRLNKREGDAVVRQTRIWTPEMAAHGHDLSMAAEASVKEPGTPGDVNAYYEMLRLGRAAEKRR